MKEKASTKDSALEKNPKAMIQKQLGALRRFNEWEKNRSDKMEDHLCMAAVFELYELIPEDARHRPVNVEGIMKMRRALACLK